MAARNSFSAGYGRRAIVRSTISPCRARLSENRRDDFTALDRPNQDRAVEYNVFGKQLAHLGGRRLTGFP